MGDTQLLLASVLVRRASFGLTNQVLTLFLRAVGVSKTNMGIFMALTLGGDTVISYFLTWHADKWGRRAVMAAGSAAMFVAGLVFVFSLNFWVLLAAAMIGVISPSGDETGPFKTVEEVCLSHLTPPKERATTFALYGFLGTLGAAVGLLLCGWAVNWAVGGGWDVERTYRAVFCVYAGAGLVKLALSAALSKNCELLETHVEIVEEHDEEPDEPSLGGFAPQTRRYLPRLMVVFMLDSFGYGFMPPAWIVYYLKTVFGASAALLGTLFFLTNSVDSLSSIASAFTFKVFGPVKAILVAQLPSAVFFGAVAFCTLYVAAAAFYFLFCACATMDVVPRQVLLTSIIPKQDLLRVLGTVNIGKTLARCIGPLFTGALAERGHLRLGFIVNAVCLFAADVVLGASFVHLDAEVLRLHE